MKQTRRSKKWEMWGSNLILGLARTFLPSLYKEAWLCAEIYRLNQEEDRREYDIRISFQSIVPDYPDFETTEPADEDSASPHFPLN